MRPTPLTSEGFPVGIMTADETLRAMIILHEGRQAEARAAACTHGNGANCFTCRVEAAPRCKHGHPFYCGHCGKVE